jgi:lysozyme
MIGDRQHLTLLCQELKRDEGIRLKPYRDTQGNLTIGVGRNLDTVGISKAESGVLLLNDIERLEQALDAKWPGWRRLNPVRQRVMLNMAFNLGIRGLLTFKAALAALQQQDYDQAAAHMLNSLWAKQVGPRARRLAQHMREGR